MTVKTLENWFLCSDEENCAVVGDVSSYKTIQTSIIEEFDTYSATIKTVSGSTYKLGRPMFGDARLIDRLEELVHGPVVPEQEEESKMSDKLRRVVDKCNATINSYEDELVAAAEGETYLDDELPEEPMPYPFMEKLERREGDKFENKFFKQLKIGDFGLSIQGHDGSYAEPRLGGLRADEYIRLEVATFYKDEWCIVKDFEDLYESWNYSVDEDCYNCGGDGEDEGEVCPTCKGTGGRIFTNDVMPYVHVEKIQELVDHLEAGKGVVQCVAGEVCSSKIKLTGAKVKGLN